MTVVADNGPISFLVEIELVGLLILALPAWIVVTWAEALGERRRSERGSA